MKTFRDKVIHKLRNLAMIDEKKERDVQAAWTHFAAGELQKWSEAEQAAMEGASDAFVEMMALGMWVEYTTAQLAA